MKILFLAVGADPANLYGDASVRYRAFNTADDLRSVGVCADVCHVAQFAMSYLTQYNVFIFIRPIYEGACKKVIDLLKRHNKTIVADFDDLLFGEENVQYAPRFINGHGSKRFLAAAFHRYTQAVRCFDFFIASTYPLAEKIQQQKPDARCTVIHNGVSKRWFELAAKARKSDERRIGYYAGGACHNADFRRIGPALRRCLQAHPHVQLSLPEALALPEEIKGIPQLERFKKMHFLLLPNEMAKCSVTIAPLLENPFNACKSAIKFLESAAAGTPIVATSIPDFHRFACDGLRYADTLPQWTEQLTSLLEFSKKQRLALQEYIYAEGMSQPQSEKLLDFLYELLV